MAVDLESDLRSAVRNGFLHVSLMREWSGEWRCQYRVTDTTEVFATSDADPVEALRKALRRGTSAVKKIAPKRRDVGDLA